MSHAENKVKWCMDKAEKSLKETGKHRGLIRIKPDTKKAEDYVKKAETQKTKHQHNGGVLEAIQSMRALTTRIIRERMAMMKEF